MDDERRIVKRHALLGKRCVACGIHFLEDGTEARDTSGEAAFRAQWARDIEAGKALPSAGDLFDKGESDGR
jgi:hypothetical protein